MISITGRRVARIVATEARRTARRIAPIATAR
jgi:antitoxin (DNA-binding transcriptional repressor) of toxin-antitoxin stability system